ncbi:MAG: reverse gyrase, partial [Candidatus Hydrothermarchaeota archaeon]
MLGRSFALLAPTGVGKTTFGIVVAQYLKGKRYLILPSRLLVEQIAEKFNALAYHSKMKKKEREEVKERIKKGDFEILVTTSMFLWKNFDILRRNTFDFIFVDDVDSVLKRDKNVDRLLYLLGYSQEELRLALELIKLKSNWEKNKAKIEELEKKIRKNKGLLLVSSATTRVKSKRVKLFRELLDFEVGATFLTLRNIEDIYLKGNDIIELIRKLGSGCLLFTLSKEEVDEWVRKLNLAKIKAVSYENFEEFEQGKASVAVGIASVKNPLARGIDLPHLIRYVIFTGVPKFKLRLSVEDKSKLFPLLVNLRELMEKEEREKVDRFIYQLKGKKANIEEIKKFLEQKLADKSFIDKIKRSKEITLAYENNELSIIIADVASYIQASGRCSRLFPGGISKGASFLFVDDEKAFNNLKKRIRWYYEDIDFKPIENINIEELMEE